MEWENAGQKVFPPSLNCGEQVTGLYCPSAYLTATTISKGCFYNGHEREHGLLYLALAAPDGRMLFAFISTLFSGRRHGMHALRRKRPSPPATAEEVMKGLCSFVLHPLLVHLIYMTTKFENTDKTAKWKRCSCRCFRDHLLSSPPWRQDTPSAYHAPAGCRGRAGRWSKLRS